jgi:hypothetical protein
MMIGSRFRSFARRLAYGRAIDGPQAEGRDNMPFYCLRKLRLYNCIINDDIFLQTVKITPLLQSLDISQDRAGFVPTDDAAIREQVRTASRGSRRPAVQVINRHPVTVTPDAVSKLHVFVPYLHTLICTNVASLNALPVELLRCPHLKIVTASPQLIIMPPPEITVGELFDPIPVGSHSLKLKGVLNLAMFRRADGYSSIKPYLEDVRASGVTHFPFIKLVFTGSGREGVGSCIDALRHAYFWPFGGLPGRLDSNHNPFLQS